MVVDGARVFIPASLVSDTYEKNLDKYNGQEIEFVVTEFNPRRRRIIGDRKQLLVERKKELQKELFERIHVGDTVTGTVKNVTDFGAFIDLGGADGLLHISEMSWGHVENPKKVFKVGEDVTVLIKKQEQLKQETERANDSGRRKSVFMANMTHEIRTPLNAIVGFSDVLPMLTTPEEKKEITRVIMNNCDILLRLINDILAVSSLETNGIHVQPTTTDFAKDFNDICNSLAQRVQEPKVQYIIDNPYESFITKIDKGRIQQVITNFVTNAIKYTHEGHIKVGYEYQEKDGGGLYIYCEDTGVGIPKEYQEKVFDRFVKLNDFIQGTGLGLSICKAIAEGCHGDIGILSEGEGQGSTFWLWIPCQREETIKESDQASDNT